ncbi:MAG: hypothetical protein CVU39_24885 [Chloroflexi bacterium HGW-Chloroflexi-10]|nr:MAG: hypothetical protein CVU39_24885 [Chloroflexi bacterium HGW-Chloroflexi-10]
MLSDNNKKTGIIDQEAGFHDKVTEQKPSLHSSSIRLACLTLGVWITRPNLWINHATLWIKM